MVLDTTDCLMHIKPALVIIPDISGFTKYMSEADLLHSQAKVAALLEAILESNLLGLEVSEIEGDAILFYDFENHSSLNDVLLQCYAMRNNFLKTLADFKKSDCQCGSCSSLQLLKLKFIVHYGMLGSVMVKNHCKLFGKDLIIAHRLLKANVPVREHLLVTEAFLTRYANSNGHFDSANWIVSTVLIDDIGLIKFSYTTFN